MFSLLPKGFFGRASPPIQSTFVSRIVNPAASLRSALEDDDLASVRLACRSVLDRRKNGNGVTEGEEELGVKDLEGILRLFLQEGQSSDLALLRELHLSYGSKDEIRQLIMFAIVKWEGPQQALDFAQQESLDLSTLDRSTWDIIISSLASTGKADLAISLIKTYQSDQDRLIPSAKLLLRSMIDWKQGYSQIVGRVETELYEAYQRSFGVDEIIWTETMYRRVGNKEKSKDMARRIKAISEKEAIGVNGWNVIIGYEQGQGERVGILEKMEIAGVQPDNGTLNALVAGATNELLETGLGSHYPTAQAIALLREAEDRLNINADASAWEILIDRSFAWGRQGTNKPTRGVAAALQIYQEMRKDFIAPTLGITTKLLLAISTDGKKDLEESQEIYGELLAAWDESKVISSFDRKTTTPPLVAYLRLLAQRSPTSITSAVQVLQELRDRDIKLELPPKELASEIMYLMKHAPAHGDAFRAYSFVRALDPRALNAEAYEGILHQFVELSTSTSKIAPPTMFFEFMKDMRSVGINPTAKIYSILVNQYTKSLRSSKLNGNNLAYARADALEAIRKAHAYIKVDSFVDVDIPLLNSLMDAYNQVGALRESFEIWDDLLARMRYEEDLTPFQPSVSIVLDQCGFARAVKKARGIWQWAKTSRFPANQQHWSAYLECLCRCGQIQEAMEEVRKMSKEEEGPFKVNENILAILLRFSARRREDYEYISAVLAEEFPNEWRKIKELVVVDWVKKTSTGTPVKDNQEDLNVAGVRTPMS